VARLDAKSERVPSLDVLRGVVMVVMALDHARDYFTYLRFEPEDMGRTYLAVFLTRWVTHFCAPVFAFLAGTGAYLSSRKDGPRAVSSLLWKRGVWLVFLEMTVMALGWTFFCPLPIAVTLWALGWSMVVLSFLMRLGTGWVGILGVAMIVLHNLADRLDPANMMRPLQDLWAILHVPGLLWAVPKKIPLLFVGYPLIPWLGVMAAGYSLGAWLSKPNRSRTLCRLGAGLSLAFVILRITNLYGNPPSGLGFGFPWGNGPWERKETLSLTVISFLNVQKYPPSLQFLLMTLGPSLMLLGWLDRRAAQSGLGPIARFFLVYGRVPMFYYVVHIYLIHAMAVVVAALFGQPVHWLVRGAIILNPIPDGYGHGLGFIYLMWGTAVLALFWPCQWFASLKRRRSDWWWRYL